MKFCPRCGSPRVGKFCESCGFEFPVPMSEPKVADTTSYPPQRAPVVEQPQITQAKSKLSLTNKPKTPGWYPDPLQERLWDGESWTELVRPVAAPDSNDIPPSQPGKSKSRAGKASAERKELPIKVLLEGLDYGPSFFAGSNCYNCGQGYKVAVDSCTTCGVNF